MDQHAISARMRPSPACLGVRAPRQFVSDAAFMQYLNICTPSSDALLSRQAAGPKLFPWSPPDDPFGISRPALNTGPAAHPSQRGCPLAGRLEMRILYALVRGALGSRYPRGVGFSE